MTPLKRVDELQHRFFMEPWEVDFLRSGNEPESRHTFLFSMMYETDDWRERWKAVEDQVVHEWQAMPTEKRPTEWIRYLSRIGYLPGEAASRLLSFDAPHSIAVG